MKTADMLRIASMSKTFTSVVVLKLIEEGVLGLNDYISDHLSDSILDKIENADDITIKHLLSMTSGIYDYSNDEAYFRAAMNRPAREAWLPEEIIAYIDGKTASFYPGEGWEYCNTNYILLEMIVALKTGKSLAQEMRRIIFNPLHMTQTFLEIKETREGGFGGLLVRGYDLENAPEIKDITEENDALGILKKGYILLKQADLIWLLAIWDSLHLKQKRF
jgi:Beta-lactamase class C and other penicillin binding proteins